MALAPGRNAREGSPDLRLHLVQVALLALYVLVHRGHVHVLEGAGTGGM